MSRYYEFDIAISGHSKAREKAIKPAVAKFAFGPDATETQDWEAWQDGSLHITAMRSLCGGMSEEEFTDGLAAAVWQANRGPCRIEVRATCLESLPYTTHERDREDYEDRKNRKNQRRRGR